MVDSTVHIYSYSTALYSYRSYSYLMLRAWILAGLDLVLMLHVNAGTGNIITRSMFYKRHPIRDIVLILERLRDRL